MPDIYGSLDESRVQVAFVYDVDLWDTFDEAAEEKAGGLGLLLVVQRGLRSSFHVLRF